MRWASSPTIRKKRTYAFHSYAMGRAGDFVLTPTDDGYVWEIPWGR